MMHGHTYVKLALECLPLFCIRVYYLKRAQHMQRWNYLILYVRYIRSNNVVKALSYWSDGPGIDPRW